MPAESVSRRLFFPHRANAHHRLDRHRAASIKVVDVAALGKSQMPPRRLTAQLATSSRQAMLAGGSPWR